MLSSCFSADERNCGLGEKARAKSGEYVCLKRRKEDFREAMRLVRGDDEPDFTSTDFFTYHTASMKYEVEQAPIKESEI